MYNNELMHFGIKGQRWGVRRYQHDDGSYTSAGKKRYGRLTKDQRKNAELVRDKLKAEMQKIPDPNELENDFFEKNPYATNEQIEKFYKSKEWNDAATRYGELSRDIERLDRNYSKSAAAGAAGIDALFGSMLTMSVARAIGRRAEKKRKGCYQKSPYRNRFDCWN